MMQDPSLLDFKTERDVNYAIANAFIFAFNISTSKYALNALLWSAEQNINEDLFTPSAPWYKGYIRESNGRFTPQTPRVSDNPNADETAYLKRDKSLVEYVPNDVIDPLTSMTDMSYLSLDNKVAILALSWWTMFISTKDGMRMVYYPYTSQLADSYALAKYPRRNVWIKDYGISEYYKEYGINTDVLPSIMNEKNALTVSYDVLKLLLESEGLTFVLWLYNYIKANKFLVPYDFSNEYVQAYDIKPTYRNGRSVDIENTAEFAREGASTVPNDIHGATGLSQKGFSRNKHTCGILLNTPENIRELDFTNSKLKDRLSKSMIDPMSEFLERGIITWDINSPISLITEQDVIDYMKLTRQSTIEAMVPEYSIVRVKSSLSGSDVRFFLVVKDNSIVGGFACRLFSIKQKKTGRRIIDDAAVAFNLYQRIKTRPNLLTSSKRNLDLMMKYKYLIDRRMRSDSTIVEQNEIQSTGVNRNVTTTVQIRKSR